MEVGNSISTYICIWELRSESLFLLFIFFLSCFLYYWDRSVKFDRGIALEGRSRYRAGKRASRQSAIEADSRK